MWFARVALALAGLGLAGCGNGPIRPDDYDESYARLVSVTIFDSTTTSGLVPITIHWLPTNCSETLEAIDVRSEPGYQTLVTLRTRLLFDANCSTESCASRDTTIDVPFENRLVILGYNEASQFPMDVATPPVGPGQHAIQVRDRGSQLPVPGVVLEHRSFVESGPSLSTVTTDSTGWAVATPGCSINPDGSTVLVMDDPEFGCGTDVLRFDPTKAPCRRALRTFLLHGPPPPPLGVRAADAYGSVTARRSTPAM